MGKKHFSVSFKPPRPGTTDSCGVLNPRRKNNAQVGDSSSQRVGEWGGVMSVRRDPVVGQVIQGESYVFTTMIMS